MNADQEEQVRLAKCEMEQAKSALQTLAGHLHEAAREEDNDDKDDDEIAANALEEVAKWLDFAISDLPDVA
jgi:hypothetical protein